MTARNTALAAGLALGSGLLFYLWHAHKDQPLTASGVIEARNITVGSKLGGRIQSILVKEGDRVQAGQLLLVFEAPEQEARVAQARSVVARNRAVLEKMLNGSRREDIDESLAAAEPVKGSAGFRREEEASARAEWRRAEADSKNAKRELQRLERLFEKGAISQQALDDARTRVAMTSDQVISLKHSLAASVGRLRAAEAALARTRNGFRREDVAAATADLELAEAQLREAEALWAEREVRAPTAAVVEVFDLRPGYLIQAHSPVAKLLEDEQLYAMVYVPETRIGEVALGQDVQIRVDSNPGQPLSAKVEQIRQQAEFLPRNVQTLEERVHQVIGVKLRFDNHGHKIRAGVHVEVTFPPKLPS